MVSFSRVFNILDSFTELFWFWLHPDVVGSLGTTPWDYSYSKNTSVSKIFSLDLSYSKAFGLSLGNSLGFELVYPTKNLLAKEDQD